MGRFIKPWIGYGLDGTLAKHCTSLAEVLTIGAPIPAMIARCQADVAAGEDVRIFTARVAPATEEECLDILALMTPEQAAAVGLPLFTTQDPLEYFITYQKTLIQMWTAEHVGTPLLSTGIKDLHLGRFYDDRCVEVMTDTGLTMIDALQQSVRLQGHYASLLNAYDAGERICFADAAQWLERLKTLALDEERS